jgi:hypothetical protein
MNRGFWLFLAAVAVSFYALDQMLDSPPAQRDGQVHKSSTGAFSQIASEEGPQERLTPSGDTVSDDEITDIQEIEEQMPTEQLAESLRNPAFLSMNSIQPSAPVDSEELIETEEGANAQEEVESPSEEELSDTEDEELPDDTVTYESEPDESLPEDEDPSEEIISTTEAGFPDDQENVDSEEVEEQILNEQMEESRKNPAYFRTSPQTQGPEETEEED